MKVVFNSAKITRQAVSKRTPSPLLRYSIKVLGRTNFYRLQPNNDRLRWCNSTLGLIKALKMNSLCATPGARSGCRDSNSLVCSIKNEFGVSGDDDDAEIVPSRLEATVSSRVNDGFSHLQSAAQKSFAFWNPAWRTRYKMKKIVDCIWRNKVIL